MRSNTSQTPLARQPHGSVCPPQPRRPTRPAPSRRLMDDPWTSSISHAAPCIRSGLIWPGGGGLLDPSSTGRIRGLWGRWLVNSHWSCGRSVTCFSRTVPQYLIPTNHQPNHAKPMFQANPISGPWKIGLFGLPGTSGAASRDKQKT